MSQAQPSNRNESGDPVSILLVDDHPGTVATLVDMFEDEGFRVETATSSEQALGKMREEAYNVALLDIWIPERAGAEPDMQGTQLLMRARALRPHMKCIMVTGDQRFEAARDALNEGAYAYIEKPFELREVAATVARALNEQRLERENQLLLAQLQDVARTLAESFQSEPPDAPGLELAHCLVTEFEVASFGGDYFDYLPIGPHQIGVIIGDVSGKGLQAHKYAAMAKYMLRAYADENPSPEWVVRHLNHALYRHMSDGMFITMVYGVVDWQAGAFVYANAGHPPAILYRADTQEVHELPPSGGMVGAIEEMEFEQQSVPFPPGSVLVLVTDGVTEARMGQRMMESEGVREVVRAHATLSAQEIVDAVDRRAREFAGGVLKDDVAIIVVKNVQPGG